MAAPSFWEPPAMVSFDDVLKINDEVTAKQSSPIAITEDIFRIQELGMDWDIGVVRYEPNPAFTGTLPTDLGPRLQAARDSIIAGTLRPTARPKQKQAGAAPRAGAQG